jgi:hypothetical protein
MEIKHVREKNIKRGILFCRWDHGTRNKMVKNNLQIGYMVKEMFVFDKCIQRALLIMDGYII